MACVTAANSLGPCISAQLWAGDPSAYMMFMPTPRGAADSGPKVGTAAAHPNRVCFLGIAGLSCRTWTRHVWSRCWRKTPPLSLRCWSWPTVRLYRTSELIDRHVSFASDCNGEVASLESHMRAGLPQILRERTPTC